MTLQRYAFHVQQWTNHKTIGWETLLKVFHVMSRLDLNHPLYIFKIGLPLAFRYWLFNLKSNLSFWYKWWKKTMFQSTNLHPCSLVCHSVSGSTETSVQSALRQAAVSFNLPPGGAEKIIPNFVSAYKEAVHSDAQQPQLELHWGYTAREEYGDSQSGKVSQIEINRTKNGTVPHDWHDTIAFTKTFPINVIGEKLKGLVFYRRSPVSKTFPQDLKQVPLERPASSRQHWRGSTNEPLWGYGLSTT